MHLVRVSVWVGHRLLCPGLQHLVLLQVLDSRGSISFRAGSSYHPSKGISAQEGVQADTRSPGGAGSSSGLVSQHDVQQVRQATSASVSWHHLTMTIFSTPCVTSLYALSTCLGQRSEAW